MIDYSSLDELTLDAALLNVNALSKLLNDRLPSLGFAAAVEWAFLAAQPENQHWPKGACTWDFAISEVSDCWSFEENPYVLKTDPKPFEVIRGPSLSMQFQDARWGSFCMRVQSAIELVGAGKKFAQGVIGSLEELASNAIEHSQNPQSTMIGYSSNGESFQLFVADAGEGLLNSLRRATEFQYLRGDDEALETAMRESVSRFGAGSGRGNGFRQVLRSLEFQGCELRFRTGGFALQMGARFPRNRISVAARYNGFYAALDIGRYF